MKTAFAVLCLALTAAAQPSPAPSEFQWTTGAPLVHAVPCDGENWHSIKDPSVVRVEGRWHVFATVRGKVRSHGTVHLSFTNWNEAATAEQRVLSCHKGYFCAPQVFYFTPRKLWYLICQASDESWTPKYQAAYSTSTNIADPAAWTPLQPLGAKQAKGKSGLDFWVICDEAKAHLFFTTNDGHMWREETSLADFPHGWSDPALSLQGDIFEASHTYRLGPGGKFLTLIEAQNGHGWRYYKAYLADRLDGTWTPLAADKDHAFASMKNVQQTAGHWTDSISHGELLRDTVDQHYILDPARLRFLYQGVLESDRTGKAYGQIPWKLGLMEPVK